MSTAVLRHQNYQNIPKSFPINSIIRMPFPGPIRLHSFSSFPKYSYTVILIAKVWFTHSFPFLNTLLLATHFFINLPYTFLDTLSNLIPLQLLQQSLLPLPFMQEYNNCLLPFIWYFSVSMHGYKSWALFYHCFSIIFRFFCSYSSHTYTFTTVIPTTSAVSSHFSLSTGFFVMTCILKLRN